MSNLKSPTKLTEFAPLQSDEKPQSVGQLISKFFKKSKSNTPAADDSSSISSNTSSGTTSAFHENLPTWAVDVVSQNESGGDVASYAIDVNEGRSLPNVLQRISNLLALKSNNLQNYADTELKQYWMPDSVSKECYECCDKFTTFRRRHHCRLCGQIFCSQCCNQQIPGKIFGCTGDLRVCTYCCKVVLSYLQSSDIGVDLSTDLKLLQESLKNKLGFSGGLSPSASIQDSMPSSLATDSPEGSTLRRKISVGYQEEKFASEGNVVSSLSNEEKLRALQNSSSLRNLFDEISKPTSGVPLDTHRYRFRTYNDTFWGSEIVDWLIFQQKSKTRIQAVTICQALLEGGYIECVGDPYSFVDGYVLYKLGTVASPDVVPLHTNFYSSTQEEPIWVQQIPHESSTTDSENEQLSPVDTMPNFKQSTSYTLDLNIGANTVYLSRPLESNYNLESPDPNLDCRNSSEEKTPVIRPSDQTEFVPESGWHNALALREENGEKLAYNILTETYDQHESNFLKQLLSAKGLPLSWTEIIIPLVHEIINCIHPDKNHNAEDLDIRHYVQFKKLAGGFRGDTQLINGIVCSKNVAHKGMRTDIINPKILLLNSSIVYQRTEGRLMSLEPVLMQEHEYLRNVAARIVALQPDVVLVQKNVSRIAQDLLREHKIALVHNVKLSILERLSRCIDADLVTSVDAHIGRPKLGTCKKFYLKNFDIDKGGMKTLMFFEGLPIPHLGATILLRGGTKCELAQIKKIASLILFTAYNWRLEKSFLMDEFAQPPNLKCEFLEDSKENSPDIQKDTFSSINSDSSTLNLKKSSEESPQVTKDKDKDKEDVTLTSKSNEMKTVAITVKDFTDPLHSSYNASDVSTENQEKFTVAELPFSNNFRKALDDTILCVSPYLVFTVPYLETEVGKKCKLREFFPTEIYYSEQFEQSSKVSSKWKENLDEEKVLEDNSRCEIKPLHPFLSTKITTSVENNNIQNLLASFRASGCRYPKREIICKPKDLNENNLTIETHAEDKIDVLDPLNHQRLAVLFCSFSHESCNAPAFCVNPWVVEMDFYGRNDIPLGCFLERYCFRPTYTCASKVCTTPMLKHVRRFVHNAGCVSITLNTFEKEFSENSIVMWTWCTKCQNVSPRVPMSADTWSYSFAKYLELKFHGDVYTRRGGQFGCNHSLHQENYQYFGYKNYVATFAYNSVNIWEISLPPPLIDIKYDANAYQSELIDEIRAMAQKGHEMFSLIQDKLACMAVEELEGLGNLKQLLQKEQAQFKQKVEEVQIKLTSPTIENKEFISKEIYQSYWKISDIVVRVKRLIVETVESWNLRLSEAVRKREPTDKKKSDRNSQQDLEGDSTESSQNDPETESLISKKMKSFDEDGSSRDSNKNIALEIGDRNNAQDSTKLDYNLVEDQNNSSNELNDSKTECSAPPSPKHQRSQSDGINTVVQVKEKDTSDGAKRDSADKKSVKNILSQLLPSQVPLTLIPNPFSAQDHYLLPAGVVSPIIVYETEPSSIVAYALNSFDYKKSFEELKKGQNVEQGNSVVNKKKIDKDRLEDDKSTGLLGFLKQTKDSKAELTSSTNSTTNECLENQLNVDKAIEEQKSSKNNHLEVQFQDSNCIFYCRIYLADKFAALRAAVLPLGEEAYIRSLSRSVQWNARGGKSGSNFAKTADDRFILKEMSRSEVHLFFESASNYFAYMEKCQKTNQPTLLGKIVGIYQIIYKNNNNASMRTNLLVMENLFYRRKVSQKFDLKGSIRNRLVIPDDQEGEIVLLDENLIKMTCDSPLYILPHSKAVLTAAIQNDTEFLSNQSVMDYSLLVGLDTENKELVLGIIDYIRTFTWDKKLETIVKKSGILGGQGKLPTIVSPKEYQKRFIEAMHKYFLEVPDHWIGLGKGLD